MFFILLLLLDVISTPRSLIFEEIKVENTTIKVRDEMKTANPKIGS